MKQVNIVKKMWENQEYQIILNKEQHQ
jgi:hypothetical protein